MWWDIVHKYKCDITHWLLKGHLSWGCSKFHFEKHTGAAHHYSESQKAPSGTMWVSWKRLNLMHMGHMGATAWWQLITLILIPTWNRVIWLFSIPLNHDHGQQFIFLLSYSGLNKKNNTKHLHIAKEEKNNFPIRADMLSTDKPISFRLERDKRLYASLYLYVWMQH